VTEESHKFDFVAFNRQNGRLFAAYLKLKYDVFVSEMQWDRIPFDKTNRTVLPDRYDDQSDFCAAIDPLAGLVGVVRGTLPARVADMYRAELYMDFLNLELVRTFDGKIATINSLAVRPEYRWGHTSRSSTAANSQHRVALSDTLMKNIVVQLGDIGAEVVLLSAIQGPSYSLMKRIGFKTIKSPYVFLPSDYSTHEDAPNLIVLDVAAIVDDLLAKFLALRRLPRDRAESEAIGRLRGYLDAADETHRVGR
jgi:hypothetical protein